MEPLKGPDLLPQREEPIFPETWAFESLAPAGVGSNDGTNIGAKRKMARDTLADGLLISIGDIWWSNLDDEKPKVGKQARKQKNAIMVTE